MLRLLADENLNGDIVRALLLRLPNLDILRVQDVGLTGVADPDILTWAAAHERIILTHDRATLPDYAYERLALGESMRGVFILNDRLSVGHVLQEILLMIVYSDQSEWNDRVVYLPL